MPPLLDKSSRSDGTRYNTELYGSADGSRAAEWHWRGGTAMAATRRDVGGEAFSTTQGEDEGKISAGQKMISATWGSLLTSLLVTPLDVVRVRLQSEAFQPKLTTTTNLPRFRSHATAAPKLLPQDLGVTACCREVFWIGDKLESCIAGNGADSLSRSSASALDCAVERTRQRKFTSTLDALQKIARNEGPLTLWRGLSPTLLMAIPANVIYFTGYDWLRSDPMSPIRRFINDAYAPLIAGSTARIAAASVISPIEMFRTRLQATSGIGADHFRATLRGLYQMTQANGYGSLWRGLTLTMWRDVPFSGLYWWGYESIKKMLADLRDTTQGRLDHASADHHRIRRTSQLHQDSTFTFIDSFVAGSTSGALAAFVTTPFDVGKTRQQVFRHSGDNTFARAIRDAAFGSKTVNDAQIAIRPEQLSMPKFLYHIFREEGVPGLFKGWVARCLKVAPACAIMISSYEVGKKMARDVNERRRSSFGAERDKVD